MTKTTKLLIEAVTDKIMPKHCLIPIEELVEKGIVRTTIIEVLSHVHKPTWEAIIAENKDVSFTREFIAESCQKQDNAVGHLFNIQREIIINITHSLVIGALHGLESKKQNKLSS